MDELFGDAPADGKVPMVELEELFADDEDMFAGIEAQDLADGEVSFSVCAFTVRSTLLHYVLYC